MMEPKYLVSGSFCLSREELEVQIGDSGEQKKYAISQNVRRIIKKINSYKVYFVLKKNSHDTEYVLIAVCDIGAREIYPVSVLNEEYVEASEKEREEIRKEVRKFFMRRAIF